MATQPVEYCMQLGKKEKVNARTVACTHPVLGIHYRNK